MQESTRFGTWLSALRTQISFEDSQVPALGILCPLAEEIAAYLAEFERQGVEVRPLDLPGVEAVAGQLSGIPVVVARCGVGKVHVAYAAQILAREAGCAALILSGVAGALNPTLDVGDLVISQDALQHDMDVRPLGFALGQIPWTEWKVFEANPDLVAFALEAAAQLEMPLQLGRVVSGDQFVADPERVNVLRQEFSGDCVEMEAGALGQVCRLMAGSKGDLPWITVRGMSDKADHSAVVDFPKLCQEVAGKSFRLVREMIAL